MEIQVNGGTIADKVSPVTPAVQHTIIVSLLGGLG